MDYPGLIMKFTLLVQAGMTVRKAFQKIALDYGRKKKSIKRAAYEEIRVVCYEMESGVSEGEAYRRFGERCGQVKYKTLATLLIQNQYDPMPVAHQVLSLFAAKHKFLKPVKVEDVKVYEKEMLKYMEREHADIIAAINEKQALDSELEASIKEALTAFATEFKNLIEG